MDQTPTTKSRLIKEKHANVFKFYVTQKTSGMKVPICVESTSGGQKVTIEW